MLKKIAIVLLLLSVSVNAQDTIRVHISPNKGYEKLMLYKIIGANQKYVSNTSIEGNKYKLAVSEENDAGIYRIYFDVSNGGYFDFIYNNEPVSVTFDPDSPEETAVFDISEENQLYQSYLNQIAAQQYKVDSLQYAYFNPDKSQSLKILYKKELKTLSDLQRSFEIASEGTLAHNFIESSNKYRSPEIAETTKKYLEAIDDHFFDYIDFGNKNLNNSSFFINQAIEYVFYLKGSGSVVTDRDLKKSALDRTMREVGENYFIRSEILSSFIFALANQQDIELTQFLITTYYNQLPDAFKNPEFIAKIEGMFKTAYGITAPDIFWEKDDITMRLSELDIAEKYIIVFWSSTCSHCLREIPQLYEFSKSLKDVKVIAVALEDNSIEFDKHTKIMTNWIHVLALDKWESQFVSDYDVSETPTYFVLDADKKIIAKPYEIDDVKEFFERN